MSQSQSTTVSGHTSFAEFSASAGSGRSYDEVHLESGEPREHWQKFLQSIGQLGRNELGLRVENGRRILREHGVGYIATGDTKTPERAWELDFLPLIISAEEWREIETGVVQRAHLLNQVLRDLFSTQRLIRDGILPAPLVYANPAYLRACQAVRVPQDNYLHTYAVDLCRAADGHWWVLADRTQTPTGVGFAQENRSVVGRVLPEAMQALQPRSLSADLRLRRDALRRLAPQNRDNPTIVLLTPGPRNEAYFEHAYLARHMGLTLVEGGDLTVRDNGVFIKTLRGMHRADVILRRVADFFCDPLELRSDSLLGVPGLVEATRAGQVTIANALGTGLIESPGFMPFSALLSRHVLNEELRLPSIATWWCGQSREFAHVTSHANELTVRPAFTLAGAGMRPGNMSAEGREALLELMHTSPHEFVGQELIRLSRAPVMNGQQWESRPIVLRVFATFDGENYTVMPGGLARTMEHDEMSSTAIGVGGGSKDVWVLGQEAERDEQPFTIAPISGGERAVSSLPSRTADNFFWLGRYTERFEHLARVTRCVIGRLNDDNGPASSVRVAALSALLVELGFVPTAARGGREDLLRELLALLHAEGRSPGAQEMLQRIHLAAFAVRDRLSADTWRILNRLETDARTRPGHLPLVHTSWMLNTLVLDLAAFAGMEMENMTRGHGWSFLDLGRRIERSLSLVELLKAALRCEDELDQLLEPVLEIADSVMTHRRRYFAELQPRSVLELLLREEGNPRSLAFQLAKLAEHATALPEGVNPGGVRQVQQTISELAVFAGHSLAVQTQQPADLIPALDELIRKFERVSELVTQVYFSHIVPRVN